VTGASAKRWLATAGLMLVVLVVAIPILWMALNSFKSNAEIGQQGTILPANWTLDNYHRLFSERYFGSYMRNTLLVCAASVFISLVLGTLAAYSLARFRLWARLERRLGFGLLTARILPPLVIVVPLFLIAVKLGLLNTRISLVVVYTAFNASFVVWMMESFSREIPVDLEEASMVDGSSRMAAFRRIVLPLAAPGLVATAIFAVIVTYNEFLIALVLTSTPSAQTVPVGTSTLIGRISIDIGAMAAAGCIAALPIMVFAIIVQRHLVRGLTLGAVK
jgi:multiple sugar transport system permease protein